MRLLYLGKFREDVAMEQRCGELVLRDAGMQILRELARVGLNRLRDERELVPGGRLNELVRRANAG